MNAEQEWLAANDEFLASRLDWLRGRLEELAGAPGAGGTGPAGPRPAARRRPEARESEVPGSEVPEPAVPGPEDGWPSDLPLERLVRAFGLSTFEEDVLFLCAAMELDTGMGGLCARAQHDPQRNYPTFALALAAFDSPAWEAMAPHRPLRYWPLAVVERAAPLTGAKLSADERIVNYIKGLDHLDGRLEPLLAPLPAAAALPPSQAATAARIAALAAGAGQAFALPGPSRLSKELVAAHVAHGFGLQLFKLDADELPAGAADVTAAARLWHREALLSSVALFIDATDAEPAAGQSDAVRRWLAQSGGLVFVATREPWPRLGAAIVTVAKPTAAEQAAAWQSGLGPDNAGTAAALANCFDLDVGVIDASLAQAERLAQAGRAQAGPAQAGAAQAGAAQAGAAQAGPPEGVHGQGGAAALVWAAALEASRPALDLLARRVDAKARLADLKLPAVEAAMLREIAGQACRRRAVYDGYGFGARMNRGTGISVLFAGESGTGKTMAAESLANDLALMLYKIDLSAVVSKYIGETEKNLRRLFDAAEAGGAVLFFDEADALFGKRSEVRDSHDRYANIEVGYLLQRMEDFNGLAVLASNRKDSLDPAFLRRLRFVVNFPFPAQAERLSMWQEAFPPQAPVDGLDLARLARLNLTGGSIHNVALNAAFLAANDGGRVTMPLVLAAARSEFRKLERPVNEEDFSWRAGADANEH
ncbi:hypothetical protein B5P43_17910 [Bacillus sp. SRB_336]|nr:hypothetical protein B5P43_17910 [Bacillus sp. SRB_336]